MLQSTKRRKSRWLVAPCQVIHQAKRPDQGIAGVEDFHGVAVVSMQCNNRLDRAVNLKDSMDNHLQQVRNKNRNIIHQWISINAVAAKDGDIGPTNAHRLNKVISAVDVVVVGTFEEEPQEDEEEEETCSVAEVERRQ